ncbi:MAG TPA: TIGR03435 family protein [Verrucomicrobiae bacterium]|jgi:uncharacterized protein (TIGR03435 family)
MTKTQTIVLTGVGLGVMAVIITVKIIFFPSISDKYFTVNSGRLKQVPSGLVVIRPTHFANSAQNRVAYAQVKGKERFVGVNMTFQMVISMAYNQNSSHITVPWNAPKNDFDVLVTAAGNPSQLLQTAIRRKLGFIATLQTNDTPVLDLKAENPNPPDLKASADNEKESENVKNGRLYLTHTRLKDIMGGIEQMVRMPVVDQTGMTNFYDFSLAWNTQMQQQLQAGKMDEETGKTILAGWGLGLEPDTASMPMLVVEKTN